MKKILLITIITTFIFSCQQKVSKKQALNRIDEILHLIVPVKTNMDTLDHKLAVFVKHALNENNGSIEPEMVDELTKINQKTIKQTKFSIKQIEELSDIKSKINLKEETLIYLQSLLEIQREHISKIIKILEDGIKVNNSQEFKDEVKHLNRIIEADEIFNSTQKAFYAEHNLKDKEINKIFNKHGL